MVLIISIISLTILSMIRRKKHRANKFHRNPFKKMKRNFWKKKSKKPQRKSATAVWKGLIRRIGIFIWAINILASWVFKLQCIQCQWWCQQWACSHLSQLIQNLALVLENAPAWNVVTRNLNRPMAENNKIKTHSNICNGCNIKCTNRCMNRSNSFKKCSLNQNR